MLHLGRKVPDRRGIAASLRLVAVRRSLRASGPSRARRPPAPRARAPPTACRGRAPSCRSARSRGPGSRSRRCPCGRVEQRERGRLVAARVLVGVVADDRRVRDRRVHAAVDAREAGAAISSTARCRSSIRPCSETANSTRSFGRRRSASAAPRARRRTRTQAIEASTTPAIAAHEAERRRSARRRSRRRAHAALRQREDDLVLGGVVRPCSISPGTGLDVDLHRRLPRERHVAEVRRRSRSRCSPGLITAICLRS